MQRRRFLRSLIGGVAGLAATHVLDPERLLWVPGAKTIFIPPPRNLALTAQWISAESLRILKVNLEFTEFIRREYEGDIRYLEGEKWNGSESSE